MMRVRFLINEVQKVYQYSCIMYCYSILNILPLWSVHTPLLYLKLKIDGNDLFSEIKHVVIDEAQDYTPLQYEVFKLLFKNATYTVLGRE